MATDKKQTNAVGNFFGGLLGKAVKSTKKNQNATAKGICKSRGLGYDPSTGKCK